MEFELLDPRFDGEPAYWGQLRKQGGLRADWSWDVLAVQAWCSRNPLLVTVLHGAQGPCGVVSAVWLGTGSRRHRFVSSPRGSRLGVLHVRGPGHNALPGWWFDGHEPDRPVARFRRLLDGYAAFARRELGAGMRGALLRQVSAAELPELTGRLRVARRTEDVAVMRLDGYRSPQEWLAALSKSRRSNLRAVLRKLDDPTLRIRVGPGHEHDHVEAARLLRHNHRKYGTGIFAPLPHFTGYLERLLRQPDVLTVSYSDAGSGNLLGLLLVLDHDQWPAVWTWSALPVELGGRPSLYFHWYSAMVTWAMAAGRRGFVAGKGMPDLKRSLGATLLPRFAVAAPVR
jgi:hypothetical protein